MENEKSKFLGKKFSNFQRDNIINKVFFFKNKKNKIIIDCCGKKSGENFDGFFVDDPNGIALLGIELPSG